MICGLAICLRNVAPALTGAEFICAPGASRDTFSVSALRPRITFLAARSLNPLINRIFRRYRNHREKQNEREREREREKEREKFSRHVSPRRRCEESGFRWDHDLTLLHLQLACWQIHASSVLPNGYQTVDGLLP